jgi:DNA-binding response OmpR family regulator
MTDPPNILVVDDEEPLAELYAMWLEEEYCVEIATSGEEAVEKFDSSFDVVLLDRRMPGLTGDETLERLVEIDPRPRIAMVTAVTPDFDIFDLGFDDYLVKPLSNEELMERTKELVNRVEYDDAVQEFFTLSSKRAAIESEKTPEELDGNEQYEELVSRIEALQVDLDRTVMEASDEETINLFNDL